ncbi:DUF6069 family protein [Angustibacter aerolatus]
MTTSDAATAPPATWTSRPHGLRRLATATLLAVVVGVAACALVVAVARAAGAGEGFTPFTIYPAYVAVGTVLAAVGWYLVGRRATAPRRLLTRLVPAVLVVSLVPDVWLGVSRAIPGTTWGAVAALAAMHVVVAATAVSVLTRFAPLPETGR